MSREISPRSAEICFKHAITLGDLARTGGTELDIVLDRMAVAEARLEVAERELERLKVALANALSERDTAITYLKHVLVEAELGRAQGISETVAREFIAKREAARD